MSYHSMLERRSSAPQGSERFAVRRSRRRRRALIALCLLVFLLLGASLWGLRQSSVRIAHVLVRGPTSLESSGGASADASLADYARNAMRGDYFGAIPRDSIFFFPESDIRAGILAAYPDIAAVSIFRNGFTAISIEPDERVPVARWCGSTYLPPAAASSTPNTDSCYLFDASGLIYAAATTTKTINNFKLYAPLDSAWGGPLAVSEIEPLRATIARADDLPAALDLARQLGTFNSPVTYIVFHGDEVDDYLASGTRVTYVLGNEQNVFTALVSARENLNLADGSLEYVDLRFGGKIYLKRKK